MVTELFWYKELDSYFRSDPRANALLLFSRYRWHFVLLHYTQVAKSDWMFQNYHFIRKCGLPESYTTVKCYHPRPCVYLQTICVSSDWAQALSIAFHTLITLMFELLTVLRAFFPNKQYFAKYAEWERTGANRVVLPGCWFSCVNVGSCPHLQGAPLSDPSCSGG